jgi:hypothetical protein
MGVMIGEYEPDDYKGVLLRGAVLHSRKRFGMIWDGGYCLSAFPHKGVICPKCDHELLRAWGDHGK